MHLIRSCMAFLNLSCNSVLVLAPRACLGSFLRYVVFLTSALYVANFTPNRKNGPIQIKGDYSAGPNAYSWDKLADYFWIDQPVYEPHLMLAYRLINWCNCSGVGFSTADPNGYGKDFLRTLITPLTCSPMQLSMKNRSERILWATYHLSIPRNVHETLQMGFLGNLVKVFPSLATRPLYITGESYAGQYIVSCAV